jgi:hypothetical protein
MDRSGSLALSCVTPRIGRGAQIDDEVLETIDQIDQFIGGPSAQLLSHDGVVGLLHPTMRSPTGRSDSDDLGATICGIGTSFDIALGLKSLHLAGERSGMDAAGLGEVAHSQRAIIDDLAEHGDCSESDRHLRALGVDAIKALRQLTQPTRSPPFRSCPHQPKSLGCFSTLAAPFDQ